MLLRLHRFLSFFFFFNDTATTEIYPLSLHDALPISDARSRLQGRGLLRPYPRPAEVEARDMAVGGLDRKSTRLNSSHQIISYAVFCLKKKKNTLRGRRIPLNPQPIILIRQIKLFARD